MDVLKPELLNIKGRCYRINPMKEDFIDSASRNTCSESTSYYEDESCTLDTSDTELENTDCKILSAIETIDVNRFRLSFHVARTYLPHIIGTKKATLKRLETETKAQITVPKFGQKGDIVITADKRSKICTCYRRISLIIMTARKRQNYTHFLSLPVCEEQIKNNFLEFKKEVLLNFNDRGIEDSVFTPAEKLHITLCMMVLCDDTERNNAVQLLKSCKLDVIDNVLKGQPLSLRVRGLAIMNDDPAEVNVLYACIHPEDVCTLQLLADNIINYFVKADIVENDAKKMKPHITLMNTRYSISECSDERKPKSRNTINATAILKKFQDYDFGKVVINSVHLSQLGTVTSSGYYKASAVVSLI